MKFFFSNFCCRWFEIKSFVVYYFPGKSYICQIYYSQVTAQNIPIQWHNSNSDIITELHKGCLQSKGCINYIWCNKGCNTYNYIFYFHFIHSQSNPRVFISVLFLHANKLPTKNDTESNVLWVGLSSLILSRVTIRGLIESNGL